MALPLVGAAAAGAAIRGIGKAFLKNAVKRARKTPNKKFKTSSVKGKAGKKNYVSALRKYDKADEKMQIRRYEGLRKFTDNKGNIVKQKTRK